jgi:hypothetical protein
MKTPNNETIRSILENYAAKYFQNEDHYIAGDIDFKEYDNIREKNIKLAIQAMKLIFTKEDYSYCDLMPIERFVNFAMSGYFIPYDGVGYYVTFDGAELGSINWDNPEDYPKEAVFVAWYNK